MSLVRDGITAHLKRLRHPISNRRNCWGAENHALRSVILLVWQDRSTNIDGRRFMQLRHATGTKLTSVSGRIQRDRHIELVRNGYRCFLINQISFDPKAEIRERRYFEDGGVRATGELLTLPDGSVYIEILGRIKVSEFLQNLVLTDTETSGTLPAH